MSDPSKNALREPKAWLGLTDIPTDCEFILDYEEDGETGGVGDGGTAKPSRHKKPWRYRWPNNNPAFAKEILSDRPSQWYLAGFRATSRQGASQVDGHN
ncbi:MAG: hypothetical protein WCR06_01115 [bacterium]